MDIVSYVLSCMIRFSLLPGVTAMWLVIIILLSRLRLDWDFENWGNRQMFLLFDPRGSIRKRNWPLLTN